MSTLIAPVINSVVAANKYHLGLFVNAQSLYMAEVLMADVANHLTAANAGTATTFVLKRIMAPGTGTAVNLRKHCSKESAPSVISALSNISSPTEDSSPELYTKTLYTEETTSQTPGTPLFQAGILNVIELWPGQGLVIQQTALASAGAISAFFAFRFRGVA